MSVNRMIRVNELLRREIGESLFRLITEEDFDLSSVTVTHVEVSRDLREARVLVSIRDHEAQRGRMLGLLAHHRREIQAHVAKNLTLKYTPRLTFLLDPSIEKGDHILSLLSTIPTDETEPPEDGAPEVSGEPGAEAADAP